MTEFELIAYHVKKDKERFIRRLEGLIRREANGCITFLGALNNKGYGRMNFRTPDGKHVQLLAHRVLFILHSAEPIPLNRQVDHQCCYTACINPEHFQLLSNAFNNRLKNHRKRK